VRFFSLPGYSEGSVLKTVTELLAMPYASLGANERRRLFLFLAGHLEIFAERRGLPLLCFTFYRTPEDQLKAKAEGKSNRTRGYHQIWQAKDYVLLDSSGKPVWSFDPENPVDPYWLLGQAWERMHPATVWGGRWKKPLDPYHFQFGGLAHQARFPCLHAELVFRKLLAGRLPGESE
jgi:hypothetical protein